MMKPVVSVVCTVYNKAAWLAQTIDSFLAQQVDFPVEIILIDDLSTDSSRKIIQAYQEKYPDQIKSFYNDSNLGIAKTWLKACEFATGDYIARCDGDDYWIDPLKLQKQVELLKETSGSVWSSTDIDYVDENGNIIGQSIFENGQVPKAHSFETMLATRGFMAPSTWLVDASLVREVNRQINLHTADDTFDIQLDLFQRTTLAYLPEATIAYRINQGSDSRPRDFQKLENRFNKLLETQNDYLDKYPTSDYREMLRILLERNNRYELTLTQQAAGLEQLGFERVTVYFDLYQQEFCQESIQQFPLAERDCIDLQLPENCHRIRIDLSEKPSFYESVSLVAKDTETEILPSFTNAIVSGQSYIFPNPDPQLIYELPQELYGQSYSLTYKTIQLNDIYADDYIGKVLGEALADQRLLTHQLMQEKVALTYQKKALEERSRQIQTDLEQVTHQYNGVIASRRWIIPTKIINFLRRKK